jgi:hypothetical protein
METVLSICIGLGLAAACGFRVFVPLLVLSIASFSGHLTLSPSFQWIGTYPALVAFSVATVLEIVAYHVPWLDNFLDTIATPAAVVAGVIVTAAMVTDFSPFLQWTLAVIAGGGIAGLVQGSTVATRALSTASTGGLANPLVASAELGLSAATSVLSLLVPVAAVLMAVALVGVAGAVLHRRAKRTSSQPPVLESSEATKPAELASVQTTK